MRNLSLADALFPKIRQNILAATYLQPEKWWFMSELAAFLNVTPSSLQRELESLTASGILRSRRDGNRLYFQAETESPIFIPLKDLITQLLGVETQIKQSFAVFADRISVAFIYGSVARGENSTQSDVDLIVIGSIGLAEISPVLRELERQFNREINANCYSVEEFQKKIALENHFVTSILSGEKIFLIRGENELGQIINQ
jgi:predicted nucleotidyltransferase